MKAATIEKLSSGEKLGSGKKGGRNEGGRLPQRKGEEKLVLEGGIWIYKMRFGRGLNGRKKIASVKETPPSFHFIHRRCERNLQKKRKRKNMCDQNVCVYEGGVEVAL
jgi:hypothetical protein